MDRSWQPADPGSGTRIRGGLFHGPAGIRPLPQSVSTAAAGIPVRAPSRPVPVMAGSNQIAALRAADGKSPDPAESPSRHGEAVELWWGTGAAFPAVPVCGSRAPVFGAAMPGAGAVNTTGMPPSR